VYDVHFPQFTVSCERPEEVIQLMDYLKSSKTTPPISDLLSKAKKKAKPGTRKAWEDARTLAKEEGISISEARKKLADRKKK
jgi:hypothetical protein